MPLSTRLSTKIHSTMLCLSGFELYSRWVPLLHQGINIIAKDIVMEQTANAMTIGMPSNESIVTSTATRGGRRGETSKSLPLKSVKLARERANPKRGPRCIMPLACKLDMTEFKGVSYFPRYGIIMYAVRIINFWLLSLNPCKTVVVI